MGNFDLQSKFEAFEYIFGIDIVSNRYMKAVSKATLLNQVHFGSYSFPHRSLLLSTTVSRPADSYTTINSVITTEVHTVQITTTR